MVVEQQFDPDEILACWKWAKQILKYRERAQLPSLIRGNCLL
jgi:hypothetical protein